MLDRLLNIFPSIEPSFHPEIPIDFLFTIMSARHQCDQTEHNFVADAFNWEQCMKKEREAARAWPGNLGEVFARKDPKTYSETIAKLKEKMEKLPVQAMMQMSYTPVVP